MSAIPMLLLAAATATAEDSVLEFSASWCRPCQELSCLVAQLQRQGLPIRVVDVEREPELFRRFAVKTIPTFVLVSDGKEVERIEGMTTESQLRRLAGRVPGAAPAPQRSSQPARPRTAPRLPPTAGQPVVRAKLGPPTSQPVDLLAATVRLRIRDAGGVNFGTGTIIDSRPGRSIVLTCGHILRDLKPPARIEVDLFDGGRSRALPGTSLGFDASSDVGLIAIATTKALPTARVASSTVPTVLGDQVVSVGCGGGDAPSAQRQRITALNRYLGPDNIECTGVPVLGRSGGGLFNAAGEVIGVCSAADPRDRRGLYAGLTAVHEFLARHGLSRPAERPADRMPESSDVIPVASANLRRVPTARPAALMAVADRPDVPAQLGAGHTGDVASGLTKARAESSDDGSRFPGAEATELRTSPPSAEAALPPGGLSRRMLGQFGDAEVICIIRPLDQPRAASRVVVINRASAKFLADLTGELELSAAGSQPSAISR